MEFLGNLVFLSCLLLPILTAVTASLLHNLNLCSNNSQIDTRIKPEGVIIFPLTTRNFTGEQCIAKIRAFLNSETELTLKNFRRQRRDEECYENSIEILNYDGQRNKFCRDVGSTEIIRLRLSTIQMFYKALIENNIVENRPKTAVRVDYKTIVSTKACRHVLTAPNGTFQTYGYPKYPLRGECEWVIGTANGEGGVSIRFQILNYDHLDCEENFIEVWQRENVNAPPWKKICNLNYGETIQSSASKLWIRVKSSKIGIQATYTTKTCKAVKVNKELNPLSPGMSSCQTWNLTAPVGQITALSFSRINLESTDSTKCLGNFLQVWDGKTMTKYCNLQNPPSIITSKGQTLVVTYHYNEPGRAFPLKRFEASFTSIYPSNFKTNCFVHGQQLSFKCNSGQVIPCQWYCDGAMQCSDNSDENVCSDMQARWHKLQLFVIVMGSICASTVVFCIGLVCFRKCFISEGSGSSRRSQHLSITDQSPLTPNADLPSPPPCYFTSRDEEPPATVIRGSYFFGDEFSQSGIHSASLFGIPPPRYRSTESLHQTNPEARSIWQRGMSSIALVPTDSSQDIPEEGPPDYNSLSTSTDKDDQSLTNETPDNDVSIELEAHQLEIVPSFSTGQIPNNLNNGASFNELHTHAPLLINYREDEHNPAMDIGITNAGASLDA